MTAPQAPSSPSYSSSSSEENLLEESPRRSYPRIITSTTSNNIPQRQIPAFVTDPSLIALARHIRLLGYDVLLDDTSHQYRFYLAHSQNRILILHKNAVTSKKSGAMLEKMLYKEPILPESQVCLVEEKAKKRQLAEVTRKLKLTFCWDRVFTICRHCNGKIIPIRDPDRVRKQVHDSVWNRYTKYFECVDCGKIFWGADDPNDSSSWHNYYKRAIQYAKQFSYHESKQEEATRMKDDQTPAAASHEKMPGTTTKEKTKPSSGIPDGLPVMPVLEL